MKPSPEEIAFAADVVERDLQVAIECKQRGFADRYGSISFPSGTTFSVPVPTNEERSRAECILFRAGVVAYGESYAAYLTRDPTRSVCPYTITTFMGDVLAHVTTITTRKVRGSGLTNERGSFWARGIDGRIYYGRHNGAGVYCRMRLAKEQSK